MIPGCSAVPIIEYDLPEPEQLTHKSYPNRKGRSLETCLSIGENTCIITSERVLQNTGS